jgi:membrane fusion protein, multidrug efflux system
MAVKQCFDGRGRPVRFVLTKRRVTIAQWARRSGLFTLAVLAGCSGSSGKPKRAPVPVSAARAQQAAVPYTIVATGVVTPMQTAAVAPQVDGIISHVSFREGQEVRSGDVLFQIDPAPYKAAFDQAAATLTRDSATNENAQREAIRYSQLEQGGYVTHEEAEQERATAASALATVQADQAAVEAAAVNLDRTTIRAPIGGRTGGLLIREGNLVHAATAPTLVLINQMEPILVRFAVPANELPLLLQYGRSGGLPVTVVSGTTTPANTEGGPPSADPVAAPTAPASQTHTASDPVGSLSFIDNAVDTTTGTIMLKATFPNTDRSLWPGQFVTVSLLLYTEQNALVVPSSAIQTGQQGSYVYVVDSANTAQTRSVVVERPAGPVTVIASGVRVGERVVTIGQSRLTPGATVTLAGSDSAPTQSQGQGGHHHHQ